MNEQILDGEMNLQATLGFAVYGFAYAVYTSREVPTTAFRDVLLCYGVHCTIIYTRTVMQKEKLPQMAR